MAKGLIIVESPAKAKTIARYVGKGFNVRASNGHIRDLPEKRLGVNIENDFEPTYQAVPNKKKTIAELKKAAQNVKEIYLAGDPDREGEAICWHIAQILKRNDVKFHRVLFQEITKNAVQSAFNQPVEIDMDKVNAQQARRVLDRLVGYKLSPLLWKKVRRGLSAGRVQSVALRLIVDREREINAFVSEESWSVTGLFDGNTPPSFEALLNSKKAKKLKIKTREEANAVLEELKGLDYKISAVESRPVKKNPYPPFITSHLQQQAYNLFGFTVKKTMSLAQGLYEGKDLGDMGTVGLITYMRTDSHRVADTALDEIRNYIQDKFGKEYLPSKPRHFGKSKGAQDAHEAIRPTSAEFHPAKVKSYLNNDEYRLYKLIWDRFTASQMNPAVFESTKIEIAGGDYLFRTQGSVLKFDGFMKAYPYIRNKEEINLPDLKKGEPVDLKKLTPNQHFTKPPSRYTEATLVKELEGKGIGRPSTYASILSVIQNRDYVNKEDGKFFPTDMGLVVTDLLVASFPELLDYNYTAMIELEFNRIEEGRLDWIQSLKDFYARFSDALGKAEMEMKVLKKPPVELDEKCPECSSKMLKREGKYGEFVACSNFPKCKYTREMDGNKPDDANLPDRNCPKCGKKMVMRSGKFGRFLACPDYPGCRTTLNIKEEENGKVIVIEEKTLDENCPKCGSKLTIKKGRYGTFTACSKYPECRYIAAPKTGVNCPEPGCGGEIVQKKSRKGKIFFSCSNYPECKFASWSLPIPEKCPKCGNPYLVVSDSQKEGKVKKCPSKNCDFKETLQDS